MGASYISDDGHWMWDSDRKALDESHTNWYPNEPDLTNGATCVRKMQSGGDRKWKAYSCGIQRYSICEN